MKPVKDMTSEKELQTRLERMEAKIDLILTTLEIKTPDSLQYDQTHPIILENLNLNDEANALLNIIKNFASNNSESMEYLADYEFKPVDILIFNPSGEFNLDDLKNIQNNSKEVVKIANELRSYFKTNYVHNKSTESLLKDRFPKFKLINHSKK